MNRENPFSNLVLSAQDLLALDNFILRSSLYKILNKELGFFFADELFEATQESVICPKEVFDIRVCALIGKNLLLSDMSK